MLPAKWHAILLLVFYIGAVPMMFLSVWLSETAGAWLFWTWMGILAVLNFTPCRGERWSDQRWTV